ncbi:hypothetical protein RchiOBHm_Chr1g0340291 [Rosa chinensis]|uniref:Uncharacterized protein n=1 Tax=Rosa chinensis TaxID=74649 RepID=A0A2P6SDE8_ROSCH|nr:hypothetical protein RchiOBHm_Chr1g0340291 [Rosa chinensis]
MQLHHISSAANVADIFTKSLPKHQFFDLSSKLIVRIPLISLRGCNNTIISHQDDHHSSLSNEDAHRQSLPKGTIWNYSPQEETTRALSE